MEQPASTASSASSSFWWMTTSSSARNTNCSSPLRILLTEAQKRTDEALKRTDEKLAALAVTVDEVTGKLNALIQVVDGIVRRPPQA
jgi:hypothetical protein